ncbi:MAG: ribosomal protein S18-alanine N-acetyltransferase [Gammaproteobacteria bacterium]|nr:ribosomal protein S18-alanine N-acetyltransferase [Gammaproteobacteria bacterium]
MSAHFSYLQTMQESDLSWVFSVEQRAYDFPWSMKGFENSLEQGLNYLFYSIEGKALGYCCLLPVLDEAHILNVCVAPEYQGKGIARAALTAISDKLRERRFNIILLEVRESNMPARQLYRQFGFTEDGVRKGYYRSSLWDEALMELVDAREDAILMSYRLND